MNPELVKAIETARHDPVFFVNEVLGGDPWWKQIDILKAIQQSRRVAVRAGHGVGKTRVAAWGALWFLFCHPDSKVITTAPCYDDQTDILTDNGWKRFSELKPTDRVAQQSTGGKIEFVFPEGYVKYEYCGEMIGYKSQLLDFLVTPDHRCFYDSMNGDFRGKIASAEDLYGKNIRMSRYALWNGTDTGINEDWAEFLGYWFAVGCADYNEKQRKYRVTVTTKKDIEYAKELLTRNKLKFSIEQRKCGTVNLVVYNKKLAAKFVNYGKALSKRVPHEINEAKPAIIAAFLKGHAQGDGHTDKNGSSRLYTSSEELAGDLQVLCLKLGITANVYKCEREVGDSFSQKPKYMVNLWKRRGLFPVIKKRTRSDIYPGWYKSEYEGFVYCVKVPTGIIMVRRNGKSVWSGNTWHQVENLLWREMHHIYNLAKYPLGGQLLHTRLEIDKQWFAIGLSTDQPERFQGYHAENILLVVDEASGVGQGIFEAAEGFLTSRNAKLLLIGNPTKLSGEFYDAFRSPLYHKIHISAYDSPNVKGDGEYRPYLVTKEWVEEKIVKWGENSPLWNTRVIGEFPEQSDDTLIPLAWVEAAQNRWATTNAGTPEELGVDVARYGSDETIIVLRQGMKAEVIAQLRKMDTMAVTGEIVSALRQTKATKAKVDVIGIGSGVVDRLKELSQPVQEMNVGMAANDNERFVNTRAEWYWGLRERFQAGDIAIPPNDDELAAQLSNIKYKFDSRGRIQIESKDEMKKRHLPSPDRADALMLSFARQNTAEPLPEQTKQLFRGANMYV